MKSNMAIEIEEDVPVSAKLKDGMVEISFDDYFNPLSICLNRDVTEKLREQLQQANEEKTNSIYDDELSEYENKVLDLESENEELKNIIEQYEEFADAYREKLKESCYPI